MLSVGPAESPALGLVEGNPAHFNDPTEACPLATAFLPASSPNCDYFSLQRGYVLQTKQLWCMHPGIQHWGQELASSC